MLEPINELSAYIICKDEEALIEACIRSAGFCAEIVIVDSGSRDGTLAIIARLRDEGLPIRLFERPWSGYAKQKQFALEQCTKEWVLGLDADERVSRRLAAYIPSLVASQTVAGWKIGYLPYLHGYGYAPSKAEGGSVLRLARRDKSHYDTQRLVHETLIVDGEVRRARGGQLLHRRDLTISEQILKTNTYARLKADQLFNSRRKPRYLRLLFNPLIYFSSTYFVRQFFRAGWSGFIYAMNMAVYSFLTEARLLERHQERRSKNEADPDDEFMRQERH